MLSPPFTIVIVATWRTPTAVWLFLFLSLSESQQLSYSDDDGRDAEQAHMRGRDR